MQLTKDDNKYRKDMFEVCPINEDPHFYYANFFLQRAPEYNKLIELHKEDFIHIFGRIIIPSSKKTIFMVYSIRRI